MTSPESSGGSRWRSVLACTSQATAVHIARADRSAASRPVALRQAPTSSGIFVTTAGRIDAPPIVLVHGIGSSSAYFTRLALELARDWRVVAVDLPGFGRSPGGPRPLTVPEHAAVLARFLREQDLTGVVLLGHSLGAQVVGELLSTEPGDVRCAVLLAPTTDDTGRSRLTQAGRLVRDSLGEPLTLKLVQFFAATACRPRVWWRTSRFMLENHLEDTLGQVRVPVLLLRGTQDRLAPSAWLQQLSAAPPGHAVVEVPGAGHVLHWSHPNEVAQACRRWVARTTPVVGLSS